MEIKTDFQFEMFCNIIGGIPFYKDYRERPRFFIDGLTFLEEKYDIYIDENYGYQDFCVYIQINNNFMEIIKSFKYDAVTHINTILLELYNFLENREKEYAQLKDFVESLSNCPNCGAPVENGQHKCSYCDTPYIKKR